MNEDLIKKMQLDFDEEQKDKSVVEEEVIKDENSSNPNAYVFDKKDELVEELAQEEVVKPTIEPKKEKEKAPKKEKNKQAKLATKSLIKSFGWLFIVLLSVIFGAMAIKDFVDKFIDFINGATDPETSGWADTGKFFSAFGYSFEAGLFIFFIVYSIKMAIKCFIPWKKYRKATEPERIEAKIVDAIILEKRWRKKCEEIGVHVNEEEYINLDPKKELKIRLADVDKLKAKYNAKKKANAKATAKSNK